MPRTLILSALTAALILSSLPASAMAFDLPHLTFPPAQTVSGSASGR